MAESNADRAPLLWRADVYRELETRYAARQKRGRLRARIAGTVLAGGAAIVTYSQFAGRPEPGMESQTEAQPLAAPESTAPLPPPRSDPAPAIDTLLSPAPAAQFSKPGPLPRPQPFARPAELPWLMALGSAPEQRAAPAVASKRADVPVRAAPRPQPARLAETRKQEVGAAQPPAGQASPVALSASQEAIPRAYEPQAVHTDIALSPPPLADPVEPSAAPPPLEVAPDTDFAASFAPLANEVAESGTEAQPAGEAIGPPAAELALATQNVALPEEAMAPASLAPPAAVPEVEALATVEAIEELPPELPAAPAALATAPAPPAQPGAGHVQAVAPDYVQVFPMVMVDGEPLGAVTLRELGAETSTVHLGALLGLFRLKMPESEFARLSGAAAADQFVSLAQLREAGIEVRYDERRVRLVIESGERP